MEQPTNHSSLLASKMSAVRKTFFYKFPELRQPKIKQLKYIYQTIITAYRGDK